MKVKLGQTFSDRKGKPVMVQEGSTEKATLGDFACIGLNAITQSDVGLDYAARLKRGRLEQKIMAAGNSELELKAEEVTMIKECLGKVFDPWTIMQCEDLLEGSTVEPLKVVS